MSELRSIWVLGNEYIDELAPWSVYKTEPDVAGEILVFAMNLIRIFMILARPIIPNTTERILSSLNINGDWIFDVEKEISEISKGHKFSIPEYVFTKISADKVAELNEKYNK